MKFHREDVAVVVGVPEDAVANDDDKKEVQDEDAPMRDSRRRSRLVVVVLLRARMVVVLGVGWSRDGREIVFPSLAWAWTLAWLGLTLDDDTASFTCMFVFTVSCPNV